MADTITTATQSNQLLEKEPRVAVMGVSGYSGGELVRLLLHHPKLTTNPLLLGRSETNLHLGDLQPQLATADGLGDPIHPFSWDLLTEKGINLLFLATPHEQSREWVPEALARNIRVVDLSGAWRLQEAKNRDVYKLTDANPEEAAKIQTEAVFGAPELHAEAIAGARLVANPGCYSTSVILALAPLVKAGLLDLTHGIICDSKSGVSGAGKAATAKTHFMYAADNLSAYGVFSHRHTGELLEQLHLTEDQIQFTPHLLPIPRGILSTIYARLATPGTPEQIETAFRTFYAGRSMVRIHATPGLPQIQHIVRTNFCDIGFQLAKDGKRLVIVSCLDNLLKGAAGQAVQNMNLMVGWNESEGLL
ncbi:N-acetyl-gamma-glutamyl-phosphate reductase [Granulicella sibirica]|uniref:N-acetyl-gamma-glutamyl-phosphate reductase n=2 Tax=Granulicella sibirica TaxID=2479048 RepID=A0A4Q0SY20_9BACT|nr:N-acetyl-gamma-glutamyl-phosphate reductase [Granulicella sibirica]